MAEDFDFIGFTFDGKHSYYDFGIYRTSGGDMYQLNVGLAPTDQTAEHVGVDGLYFLGSTYKNQEFDISFAFDNLTEEKLREMKQWLNVDQPKGLIFDEWPYKEYSVTVSGIPTIKFVCFDQRTKDGEVVRIYKGEGNIKFTCHDVYAKEVKNIERPENENQWKSGMDECGDVPFDFKVKIAKKAQPNQEDDKHIWWIKMIKDNEVKKTVNITHKDLREALSTNGSFVIWDSKTGLVYHEKDGFKKIIPSTGNTFGGLEPGLYTIQSNCEWILCTYTSTYRYI